MITWALVACLLTIFNQFVGVFFPAVVKAPPLIGHLLALPYLGALLYALLRIAQAAVHLPVSTGFRVFVGVLLAFPSLSALIGALTPYKIAFILFDSSLPMLLKPVVYNLLGPVGLALLGSAIGRIIKHPNTLLAASGFSVFFDIVVVTMGTVAQLMKSGSNLIATVSVGAGAPAAPAGAVNLMPPPLSGVTIGPADVLFVALFLSSVVMLKLEERATFRWMFLLLMAALAVVETTALPVPALVPMGIAVLIANARHAAFTRDEKYALIYGTGFAMVCAVGIILASRSLFAPPPSLGFDLGRLGPRGPIIITNVQEASPAARGGLLKNDILLEVNNIPVSTLSDEEFEEARKKARQSGIALLIRRRGEGKPRTITLIPDK